MPNPFRTFLSDGLLRQFIPQFDLKLGSIQTSLTTQSRDIELTQLLTHLVSGESGRSEDEAKYRCASYQEDGIPAGRWRLPTLAEVQFISTLSSLGRIPYLFGNMEGDDDFDSNSYYWTANGLIRINNGSNPPAAEEYTGSTNNIRPSVRCVYDEWFWGDATTQRPVAYDRFTWGDNNY